MRPSSTPIFDLIRAIESRRLEIKRATHTHTHTGTFSSARARLIVYRDLLRAFIPD